MIISDNLKLEIEKFALSNSFHFKPYKMKNLIDRMDVNFNNIVKYSNALSDIAAEDLDLIPGCEWILDNFYKVEEQVNSLRLTLKRNEKVNLGVLENTLFKDYPRIYPTSLELIRLTNGNFDEKTITEFLKTYQNISVFSIGELWAFSTMLILAIVEKIENATKDIYNFQIQKLNATSIDLANPDEALIEIKEYLHNKPTILPIYIEFLVKKLKKENYGTEIIYKYLDEKLLEYNTTIDKVVDISHITQSSSNILIGNLFTSLNKIALLDWYEIFETVSVIEKILRKDPSDAYSKMDFKSRNYYRTQIEKISKKHNIVETKIALKALALAEKEDANAKKKHIGYFIIDKGKTELLESLELKPGILTRYPFSENLYILQVITFTFITSLFVYGFTIKYNDDIIQSLLLTLLFVIPLSELIIKIFNYILKKIYPYAFLPKLEFKENIPEEYSTFVVIPTLLTSEEHVREMYKKIELYYLANKGENLYFALLGEFKDSNNEIEKQDNFIIETALKETKMLNEKYSSIIPIFFYFQRRRQYNDKQNKWMCWERKRGSLTEFNNLISGINSTSHIVKSSEIDSLIGVIKYVLTLDEDTQLPIDAAKKLIGTISHPLNEAVYDENLNRVVEGYGVIQPNVCVGLECSSISKFTRIYARASGASIYIEGYSDIYQDVFNDGIFFGKGIYNLRLFTKILNIAIPQNKVLSHDLLEGSHIGAAFASDINLIDTHPSKYIPYLLRLHRWVRGDWQLISWLRSKVKNYDNEWVKNPLSTLSKWKIFDNLRRSLCSITLFVILIAAFTILPGPIIYWILFIFFYLSIPIIIEFIDSFFFGKMYKPDLEYRKNRKIKYNLRGTIQYTLIQLILLPFEAAITLSAILISLYRVVISKNNLLEWTTAAISEKKNSHSIINLFEKMKIIYLEVFVFIALVSRFKPTNLYAALVLAAIWSTSPLIVYYLDRKIKPDEKPNDEETILLRKDARKIWSYFEDFSKKSTHYLPPDNYQVYPPKGVAERTSPTNIGLSLLSVISARDMGFLSITRMIKIVSNMLHTIDRLEKWDGHLYNWYNTRNLSVLRPRYVSSVDSGNFVGYLIVLKQSLNEYRNAPVIDDDIVQGLKETCEMEHTLTKEQLSFIDSFGSITGKTADEWIAFLNMFISISENSDVKCSKRTMKTVHELIDEHYKYFHLIKYENEYFEKKEFTAVVKKIGQIKMDMSLSEVRSYYNQILMEILQKKKSSEYDPLCITALEYKIKSIICNLDDLLKSLDQMINIIERLIKETKFSNLYDGSKNLFSIGYDCENNQLTNSYYDLMASESRITSYISVITKQVPPEHWYKLSRTFTLSHHHRALASWSGTMFEYFMPSLILYNYEYSIFDETYHSVIMAQQKYSEVAKRPWGVSESAYYFFDLDLNYQYKAFGVPDLGFKRGLINDYVVSPYSTYFALNFDKDSSIKNLQLLREENASGIYGLYESIDYTKQRIENDGDKKIVKSYMAHHLGMSLLSINNFINDNIMQKRFHSEPIVQTGEFLLQEKTPYRISIIKELKEKQRKVVELKRKEIVLTRVYSNVVEGLPECHMISNKRYHVMITNTGIGYSQFQDKMVTRFRSDLEERFYGYTFFFKNIATNNIWTIGSEPISSKFKDYEVRFSLNKAEIIREDNQITTHIEIWVSPEDDVEIRQITFFNNGNKPVSIETTSYAELVLNNQSADITHPAFSNLFISTSYDKETESLIAVRKPRNPDDKETYIFKTMVCEGEEFGYTQYETNRSNFIGRGRTLKNPIAIEKLLDNTEGVVLEPILSLRKCVNIESHQKSTLTYIMGVTDSHSKTEDLISKYKNSYVIKDQLDLSAIQTQVEMNYLDLNVSELKIFLDMIPQLIYLNPNRRKFSSIIQNNKLGQTSLWKYGISGDLPIILTSISSTEHIDNIWTLIKAKEFWKLKGINTNLIILNDQESSYFNDVEEEINEMISKKFGYHSNVQSLGIFIMNNKMLHDEDRNLLYASANIIIDCDKNNLGQQIKLSHQNNVAKKREYQNYPYENINYAPKKYSLKYFNGYGGFNISKKEYVIKLHDNITTPAPWINVISNENFGFIVSENGGGFTWSENSNENKLTPWLNDAIFNIPQEVIYVKDEKYGKLFSLTPDPLGKDIDYDVIHGKGYSKFFSRAYLLESELTLSVPLHDKVKIYRIKVKNNSDETRKLSYFFSVTPVLGVHREITKKYIITKFIDDKYLMITNPYNHQYPNRKMYISSSEPIISYSGDSEEINQHDLYRINNLSNRVGGGLTPCGTLQVSIEINANEEKELIFILGQEQAHEEITKQIEKYSKINNVNDEYGKIHNYWDAILDTIKVRTPDHKFDVMLNSWLPYQSISCRLNARSAFYQTGGAYGYRDQLQDAINMISIDPKLAKKQILLNAAHQFPEGDVLHWWHPGDIEKGIRTRFSDDLLWLPYAVSEYLLVTEDYSILDLKAPYVIGELLKKDEKEVYFTPSISDYQETIYDHCVKAINHSLKYGEHGIPLMGGGDWNDGMNEVGIKGKGESVWLGWFLSLILDRFIIISHQKNDLASKEKFTEHLKNIVDSLEKNAWDGSWYRRAFYDDGTPLGSIVNSECMIDSLSQSWAVISGHADYERSVTAMNSVRNHLILKDKGMILLFTPPFDKTKKNPGYIKSYAKGVRENGGQYTHAASWVINAFALLGEGNKAFELLQMLNPINHSPSIFRANNYKVEPYVIPADIYNVVPHVGRGGWTWYTGAAGWMYRVGIESILGFKKRGDKLYINPCIPNNWQSYKIEYLYQNTLYIINVINNDGISHGLQKYTLDGNLLETDYIELIDDHTTHQIEVFMVNN